MNVRTVSPRHAAVAALVIGVLSYGGLRLWREQGHQMPHNNWITLVLLALVAAALLTGAWQIREYVRGRSTRPPSPQGARMILVAAQAVAVGGAAVAGWYLAQAAVLIPDADVDSIRQALIRSSVLALGALGLSGAGFLAQQWCRIPPGDDEDSGRDDDGGGPRRIPTIS